MVRTGYNKEHIPVAKWRTGPPEVVIPQRGEIINCLHERRKVSVAYACGLVETLAEAYRRGPAENRKICRRCAGEYGLNPHVPGQPLPVRWWIGNNVYSNGRALGIIPHPLPRNWRLARRRTKGHEEAP